MTATSDDSQQLLARLRAGDSEAAALLHDRYVSRLVALARSRLSQKMARRVDAEDVVQSVYRSFFAHAGEERYVIERGGDMWRLLSAITVNKVLAQVEHHKVQKRSIDREQNTAEGDEGPDPLLVATDEPLPEQALILVDELEAVMQMLDAPARQALEMRLQGLPMEQIAHECDCSERTVRRYLERARIVMENRLLESRV